MKLTTIFAVAIVAALGTTSAQADHRRDQLKYVLGGAILGAAIGELVYDGRRGHNYGRSSYRHSSNHYNYNYGHDRHRYRYDSHSYGHYPRSYRSSRSHYQPRGYSRSHRDGGSRHSRRSRHH